MCYKTFLALLLVAVSAVSAQYVTHAGSELVCIPCGPKPQPHVYLAGNFSFDNAKGTWLLIYTNDLPPEAGQECIHWPIYPNNDTVGNINRCWNNNHSPWWNLDCARRNGGGFVTYSRPDLTYGAFFWESARWSGKHEYFVLTFEEDLLILVRCDTVRGKPTQFVYVLTRETRANNALARRVSAVLQFNSMNPATVALKVVAQWDCNYINNQF